MAPAARFRRLPKAELHVHLDGSLRPATLVDLARAVGAPLPTTDPAALRDYMRVEDARDLEQYLARFALTIQVLRRAEALERVAHEMVLDAAADGVRYLEARYCPALSVGDGLTLDEVFAAQRRGFLRGERETGVQAAIIACTLRHFAPERSEEIAEAAVRQRGAGVVAFDIAGGEAGRPAAPHRHAFEIARRGGLACIAHAGEAAGPASIAEALFECGAQRIGHGTRLEEDPALLAYVRDHRIPVECCLTSNRQTHAVPSLAAHPLPRYLAAGLCVTLCTDNWLMSDVTLSSEFALAQATFGLADADCRTLVRNAMDAAFLAPAERAALAATLAPDLDGWA